MKKTAVWIIAIIAVFVLITQNCRSYKNPTKPATSQAVTFADPNLEAAIRAALNKPTGTITQADMSTITYLNISSLGITNLSGLQYCTNLKVLYMWNNSVSDLSPLAGLTNLTDLYAMENSITSVAPLVNLINLRNLDLDDNNISDITAINANSSAGGICNHSYDFLSLATDPLNSQSVNVYIPDIEARTIDAIANTSLASYVNIKILDSTNSVVKTMTAPAFGGPYALSIPVPCLGVETGIPVDIPYAPGFQIAWDGTNLSNNLVPTGNYIIQMIVRTQTPSEQVIFAGTNVTIINGNVCGAGNTCTYGSCSITF